MGAFAQLVFEKEKVFLKPTAAEEKVTATFAFTHKGARPILIKGVDANCGCLSAVADQPRYENGDRGKLTVVFEVGDREGKQSHQVWIDYIEELAPGEKKFDPEARGPSGEDPNDFIAPARKNLAVEIDIPVVVEIEPKMTSWKVGSAPELRKVTVTMNHLTPIHLRGVTSSRPDVKVETKTIKEGEKYVITLTPQSTEKKQLGMLTLETDCRLERHRKKLAFFRFISEGDSEGPGERSPSRIIGPGGEIQ